MKLNRKFIYKINFKKLWEYLAVFVLFLTFIVDNRTASEYNKEVLNIWSYKMPYGLEVDKLGPDYTIIDAVGDIGLMIFPFDGKFALDKNLYIQQNLGYCQLKDRLAFFVRTKDNDLKVVTIKGKAEPLPYKKRFQYKIYTPKEFFSDTTLFPDKSSYYIPCTSLRGETGTSGTWPIRGRVILFLLISWFVYKVYHFFINKYKMRKV